MQRMSLTAEKLSAGNKLAGKLLAPWLLAGLLAVALPLHAAMAGEDATPWQGTDEAAARLIIGQNGLDAAGKVWLGLQFRLKPGWKTYWRNPGEAGAPPLFDWQASENLAAVEVKWPAPRRFSSFGFDSFGYHDEVVLPILLQAASPGKPIRARLNLDYMVCLNVCIPMQGKWTLDLNPATKLSSGPASATTRLIHRYLDMVPLAAPSSGLEIRMVSVSGPVGKQILRVTARAAKPFLDPDLMVEAPEPFGFGRPKATFSSDGHDLTLALPVYAGIGKAELTDQALVLTLVDGRRAMEHHLTLGK